MQASVRGTCRATFQGGAAPSRSSCDISEEWNGFSEYWIDDLKPSLILAYSHEISEVDSERAGLVLSDVYFTAFCLFEIINIVRDQHIQKSAFLLEFRETTAKILATPGGLSLVLLVL